MDNEIKPSRSQVARLKVDTKYTDSHATISGETGVGRQWNNLASF